MSAGQAPATTQKTNRSIVILVIIFARTVESVPPKGRGGRGSGHNLIRKARFVLRTASATYEMDLEFLMIWVCRAGF